MYQLLGSLSREKLIPSVTLLNYWIGISNSKIFPKQTRNPYQTYEYVNHKPMTMSIYMLPKSNYYKGGIL